MLVRKLAVVIGLNCCWISVANAAATLEESAEREIETIKIKQRVDLLRSDLDGLMSSTLIEQQQLQLLQSSSLGETLKMTPGVHANYFGPSSSSPIIRGLDGARIKVMQNGLDSGDASRLSPDHQISSETSSATAIEILRGPATLLHGSGAIGGVVNVIDQRIAKQLSDSTNGALQASINSGDNEKSVSGHLQTSVNDVALYGDMFVRDADDTSLPDELDHQNIENSQANGHGFTLGASYIEDNFRLGFSVGSVQSQYGLIGHAQHEEEHDEHEEKHNEHEEEHNEHHEDEHHDELMPFVDTKQQRIGIEAHWLDLPAAIDEVSLKLAYTDYQLQEIEHQRVATQIDNVSSEVKLQLHHRWLDRWEGIMGLHWQESKMTPVGEEASSAPATTDSVAVFATQTRQVGAIEWQFGARVEHVTIAPDLGQDNTLSNISFTPVSWSGGLNWQIDQRHSLLINLNHSQRALSAAELFSFGEHLGTSTFGVGAYFSMASHNGMALYQTDDTYNKLTTEDANTLDVGWQYDGDEFSVASSLYYSEVNNFAYQAFIDLAGDGLPIYQYQQADVILRGGELQLNYFVTDNLTINGFVDKAQLTLKSGEFLPRVPPMRIGAEINYEAQEWQFMLNASHYAKQDNTAPNETATDAYTLVGLTIATAQEFERGQIRYYFKITNLLDQYAQVHSSFIKEQAPLPGISAKLGVRWTF